MGRARKNQRENIRKRRLAKRKRREKGKDSDVDAGYNIDGNNLTRLFKVSLAASASASAATTTVAPQEKTIHDGEEDPSSIKDSSKKSDNENCSKYHQENVTDTGSSKPVILDKIERMRQKKQQQKARRREKKAAKALIEASIKLC